MVHYSSHAVLLPQTDNMFLMYQLVTRKGVLLSTPVLHLVNDFIAGKPVDSTLIVNAKDVSSFSLAECLLDNPNGLLTDLSLDPEMDVMPFSDLSALLFSLSIIVDNDDYIERLGKKANLFDKVHIGNFHQQIGQYVLTNQNINAEMWWITQKFLPDYSGPTDTPYRWVQEVFMKKFFTRDNVGGKKVLDFGCGIGYYSRFFEKVGGIVTGVDPSESYLKIAKEKFSGTSAKYIQASFDQESDFQVLEAGFDIIFLSDVFLYYFEPYKKMAITPEGLLRQLSGLLNDGGAIYIMDPHGVFHLQPWINASLPFVMSLEYAKRRYRVTPNLEEVSQVAEAAGLCITKIRELKYEGADPAHRFYAEFPFWWFFELKKNTGR